MVRNYVCSRLEILLHKRNYLLVLDGVDGGDGAKVVHGGARDCDLSEAR